MKFAILGTCVAGDMLRMPKAKEYDWTLVKNVVSFSPFAIVDSYDNNQDIFADMPADVKEQGVTRQNEIDDLNGSILGAIKQSNPDFVIVDLNEFRIGERVIKFSDGKEYVYSAKGYSETAKQEIVNTVEKYYNAKAVKVTERRIADFTDEELKEYIAKYNQILEKEFGKDKVIYIETNPIVNYMCNSLGGGTIKYVENFKTTGNICKATQRLYALCKGIINAIPFPENNIGDDSCTTPFVYHYCKPYYDYLTESIRHTTEGNMTEELQQDMFEECKLNIHSIYNAIFCKQLLPKLKNKLNKKIVLIAKTKQFNDFIEACYSKRIDYFINYNEYTDYEVLEKVITEIIKTEGVDRLFL